MRLFELFILWLWFFHAMERYVNATRDQTTLEELLPKLVDVAHHHVQGTRFNIGVDPQDGLLRSPSYPDVLERVWSALSSPTAGEVLLSAAEGYEFMDWGRQSHVGGGSHG